MEEDQISEWEKEMCSSNDYQNALMIWIFQKAHIDLGLVALSPETSAEL